MNKHLLQDLIFFIIVIAVPSSFFGIINEQVFYKEGFLDLRLISWLLTLPYLFFYFKNNKKIYKIPSLKYIYLVILYIILIFFISLIKGHYFIETFKVFRVLYFTPISCLALLLYVYSMSAARINRFLLLIIISLTIQGFFYIIDLSTGFSIFSVSVHSYANIGDYLIKRYNLAFPIYNTIVFSISLLNILIKKKNIWLIPFFISTLTILMANYRGLLIIYVSLSIITMFLHIYIAKFHYKKNILKFAFLVILVISIFRIFFSGYYSYLNSRMNEIFTGHSITLYNVPSYNSRFQLVQNVLKKDINTINLLFGNGYIRYSSPGEYDLSLGCDTHLAPIIYTEGFIGLTIRLLPIFYILISNILGLIYFREKRYVLFNIFNISIMLSSLINYIQTPIFRDYNSILLFVFILEIIKYKDKNLYHNLFYSKKFII